MNRRSATSPSRMLVSAFALLLTLLGSGVGAASARTTPAGRSEPAPFRSPADSLVLVQRVDHLDAVAREPMIVQDSNGTLFVAGYPFRQAHAVPQLWVSRDRGATWTRVHLGTAATGAVGNSDVDLAIGPMGTVYMVVMDFDRSTEEGRGIAVGVSRDEGATWSWTTLSRARFDDRPWVGVGPDGTAHVIWNDGRGVLHSVSTDGGRTWTERARISTRGGSSHLAIGPNGAIAVRITPASASYNRLDAGVDFVAISTDGGTTWKRHAPPARPRWAPLAGETTSRTIPRWVEPMAWDATGRLYELWTDSTGVWLSRSADDGSTWTSWRVATSSAHRPAFYPYLVARGRGELAATWFSENLDALQSAPDSAELRWHVALISAADTGPGPTVIASQPLTLEAHVPFVVHGDTVSGPDPGGEYLAVTFLRGGGFGVVTPIENAAAHRLGFSFWRFAVRNAEPPRRVGPR